MAIIDEGVVTTRFLDPPKSSEHREQEVGMELRSDEMACPGTALLIDHFFQNTSITRNSLVEFSLRCLQSGSDHYRCCIVSLHPNDNKMRNEVESLHADTLRL